MSLVAPQTLYVFRSLPQWPLASTSTRPIGSTKLYRHVLALDGYLQLLQLPQVSRRNILENWAALYANQTKAERALEPHIAALGLRYRSQHPYWGICIADFVLLDEGLIIEVDGPSHDTLKQKIKDADYAVRLKKRGWDVVRIKNEDCHSFPEFALKNAITNHRPRTLEELEDHLQSLLLTASAADSKPTKRAKVPGVKRARESSGPKRISRKSSAES